MTPLPLQQGGVYRKKLFGTRMEAASVSTGKLYAVYLWIIQQASRCPDLRYYPGTLSAILPCWNWNTNQQGSFELGLPRTLAYAANAQMVNQPYDGNLGLGIYE